MALLNTATCRDFIVEFLGVHSFEDFVTPCSLVGYPPTRLHAVTRQMFCSLSSPSTFLTSQQFSLFSKQYIPPDQALLIHCSAKTTQLYGMYKVRVTAFCTGIDRAWRRLSSFNLSCSLCGIIPFVDNTKWYGIDRVHWPHTYKLCFQVCVLLEVLGDAAVKVV
jgi:hypothetical protein